MPLPGSPKSLWPRLLLVFLVVPIVELALLIWLGGQIGFWPTMGLIIATALVGSWLAQREGVAAWRRFNTRIAAGQLPGQELTDGLIILVSGAFLLTPGVLTDVVGLLGLFPLSRAGLRRYLSRKLQDGISRGSLRVYAFGQAQQPPSPPVEPRSDEAKEEMIDASFEEFETRRNPRS